MEETEREEDSEGKNEGRESERRNQSREKGYKSVMEGRTWEGTQGR